MSEKRYRATLYRVFGAPGCWEIGVAEDGTSVNVAQLNSKHGMAPSDCDRGVALRSMGYQVGRYQAWDWFEVHVGRDEPAELMARVHVVPVPERTSGG